MTGCTPRTKPAASGAPTAREIIHDLLIRIPVEFPGARAWRRNVGAAMTEHGFVRYGLPGEADITGIAPGGLRLEIEVKARRDRLSPAQVNFLSMVERAGGIAVVAHDVAQAIMEIRRRLECQH